MGSIIGRRAFFCMLLHKIAVSLISETFFFIRALLLLARNAIHALVGRRVNLVSDNELVVDRIRSGNLLSHAE